MKHDEETMTQPILTRKAEISVNTPERLLGAEMDDLCYATEEAVRDGIGFNWSTPPSRDVLENYWKGVLLVPERQLFLGKLDGVAAGAVQLVRPGPTKQSASFAARIEAHFVAPFARGAGLARHLLTAAEAEARKQGFTVLKLDVRETQERAIQLYLHEGWKRWGILPRYERVENRYVAGHFFHKDLD